jgi:hypothetical protein
MKRRNFVSEQELEAAKKTRSSNTTENAAPYDPRPLYEKLQEKKQREQEEWEEQMKASMSLIANLNSFNLIHCNPKKIELNEWTKMKHCSLNQCRCNDWKGKRHYGSKKMPT